MISNLPGKALRTLVDIARLAERFNNCSQSEPGKIDMKRRKPGILAWEFVTRSCLTVKLTRHRKRFIKDDYYVQHARPSLENIIRCFQGKHGDCRQRSMVCEAHLPSYTTQSLPYGQHIKLSTEDIDKIKTVLRKYLSTDCLKEMVKLSNTNQCESIHSQLFRWAPKHTAWSRNFTGLCHSVVHSASLGTGKSILKTAELLKIPVSRSDPFFQHMIKVDSVSKFHGRRQATVRYKSLWHPSRKGKVN